MGGLTAWIGYLGEKKLKPKTIKGYLARLQSLLLDCTLDKTELEVYSHPIPQKIIADLRKLYGDGDTCKHQLITRNILLQIISRFDQTTFERANFHSAFCLVFAGFLRMGKFNYDNVEPDFSFWNLTQGSVSLLEDRLFLVFLVSKTDPLCWGVTLTILVATDNAFAVKSLWNLFKQFSKAYYQLLFTTWAGTFSCNYVTKQLQEKICTLGYEGNYTGHSFQRETAKSARLAGLSEEEIQLLGQ